MTEYLFYGGPILTMERPSDAPEALTVREGRIRAVGTFEALRAQSPGAWLINLKGRALLPAFLDCHGHFVQYAGTLERADLTGCASLEQLARRMNNFIRQNGIQPGQTVVGFGYDPAWMEGCQPDRALLDRVSRVHPILLIHRSGRMGVLNSLALATLGLAEDVPDPPGSRYGRDGAGRLTGLVEGEAFCALSGGLADPPGERQALELLQKAQQLYFSQGFTTAQEGFAQSYEAGLLRRAADEGLLRLDLVGYADIRGHADLLPQEPARRQSYQNHFRMGGYALALDGTPQDRAAWTREDYADQPGYRGTSLLSGQEITGLVALARARRAQLLCNSSGDEAAARFLAAHAEPSPCRDVLLGAQLVRPDQMTALKKAGILPSFFVAHTHYWADSCLCFFGPARTLLSSPAASARAAGLPYTFHSDSPVLPPSAPEMLWCACNRRTGRGLELSPEEKLRAWDALLGLTRYGAWQYGEEAEKGTLTPGKKADLVILSADPRTLTPEELLELTVEATFKEGVPVYRREKP